MPNKQEPILVHVSTFVRLPKIDVKVPSTGLESRLHLLFWNFTIFFIIYIVINIINIINIIIIIIVKGLNPGVISKGWVWSSGCTDDYYYYYYKWYR